MQAAFRKSRAKTLERLLASQYLTYLYNMYFYIFFYISREREGLKPSLGSLEGTLVPSQSELENYYYFINNLQYNAYSFTFLFSPFLSK